MSLKLGDRDQVAVRIQKLEALASDSSTTSHERVRAWQAAAALKITHRLADVELTRTRPPRELYNPLTAKQREILIASMRLLDGQVPGASPLSHALGMNTAYIASVLIVLERKLYIGRSQGKRFFTPGAMALLSEARAIVRHPGGDNA